MSRFTVVASAVLSCALLSACGHGAEERGPRPGAQAQAQGIGPGHGPGRRQGIPAGDMFLFVAFDRDADYRVTFEEVTDGAEAVFKRMDTDGSGGVTQVEYGEWAAQALGDAYAEPYFLHLDGDQNSLLTKEEFLDALYARARRYDENRDNVLTFAELRPKLMQGGRPGVNGERPRRRRGGGRRRGGRRGPGMPPGGNW